MIKFKYFLKEAFQNYDYELPEDKEQLMYDFYLLSALPYDPDATDDDDKTIAFNIVEARRKLFTYLQKHLLNSVFFAICAEFRHMFDNSSNTPERILKFAQDNNMEDFMREYMLLYMEL